MRRLSQQLAEDPGLMADVARIWAEKMRDGEFQWFAEFLKRVDPAVLVQEITLAGALEPADIRAALAASRDVGALGAGDSEPTDRRPNGSNGSGV